MSNMNKALILGRVGQDPETRYLADGTAVTNLSVATSEKWKDKNGNKQESTEWHRVAFFGKTAEVASEYVKKGSLILVEGKLTTNKWEDKEGNKRESTQIRGERLTLVGKPPQDDDERPAKSDNTSDDLDRDIPF